MKTSIKIMDSTKKKLNLLKYKLDLKSIDEVINKMHEVIVKFKLGEELKWLNKK